MVDFSKTTKWSATIAELEGRAGITAAVEDARLGPMIPNFKATTEEYFDETYDFMRRKVRKIYFALPDVELRRQLIGAQRQLHHAYRELNEKHLKDSVKDLEKAKHRIDWLPWMFAAIIAVACVALGAKYFGLYGALAGVGGGFFAGQAVAASKRREQVDEIRLAEGNVEEAQNSLREHQLTPEWFNAAEEQTGERDPSFDDERLIANRA